MTQESFHYKTSPIVEKEVKHLVLILIDLLKNWDIDEDIRERDTSVKDL